MLLRMASRRFLLMGLEKTVSAEILEVMLYLMYRLLSICW